MQYNLSKSIDCRYAIGPSNSLDCMYAMSLSKSQDCRYVMLFFILYKIDVHLFFVGLIVTVMNIIKLNLFPVPVRFR